MLNNYLFTLLLFPVLIIFVVAFRRLNPEKAIIIELIKNLFFCTITSLIISYTLYFIGILTNSLWISIFSLAIGAILGSFVFVSMSFLLRKKYKEDH